MRKPFIYLLIFGCFSFGQGHAFVVGLVQDYMHFKKLEEQKDFFVKEIKKDLFQQSDNNSWTETFDQVCSQQKNYVKHICESWSDKKLKEYAVILFKSRGGKNLIDVVREIEHLKSIKMIRSSEEDMIYEVIIDPTKDDYSAHRLARIVASKNNLIFFVQIEHDHEEFSKEERQKWLSRLENLSYLNRISEK